jgi:SMC interacting uncharacterized protein involved in chromosome segregation
MRFSQKKKRKIHKKGPTFKMGQIIFVRPYQKLEPKYGFPKKIEFVGSN